MARKCLSFWRFGRYDVDFFPGTLLGSISHGFYGVSLWGHDDFFLDVELDLELLDFTLLSQLDGFPPGGRGYSTGIWNIVILPCYTNKQPI